MTSKHNKQILSIRIKPSITKILIIVVPHVLIASFLLFNSYIFKLGNSILMLSLLFTILSLFYFIKLHLNMSLKQSIYSISRDINNKWWVNYKNKKNINITLSSNSFVSNYLILLNTIDASKKCSTIIITPDSIKKDQFRQLKVILKTDRLEN